MHGIKKLAKEKGLIQGSHDFFHDVFKVQNGSLETPKCSNRSEKRLNVRRCYTLDCLIGFSKAVMGHVA